MSKHLCVLPPLLALILTGCGPKDPHDTRTVGEKAQDAAHTAANTTKEVAAEVRSTVAAKLNEWKLTPADIRADLEKGGRVVRRKAEAAGEKVAIAADNARIVTVINAKYVRDPDLSALRIDVDASHGTVTLQGTVDSADLVSRAMLLALDTDGVIQVISLLTIRSD